VYHRIMSDLGPMIAGGQNSAPATPAAIRQLVEAQAAMLVAVATGGPRIEDVNAEYQDRRALLERGLRRLGIEPPFPWRDMWAWYGHWSQRLGSYASRRCFIAELAAPVLDRLDELEAGAVIDDPGRPDPAAAWAQLEARLTALKGELAGDSTQDDCKTWGVVRGRS